LIRRIANTDRGILEQDRKRAGWSVGRAAWELGVTVQEYQEFEAGERVPSGGNLRKAAVACFVLLTACGGVETVDLPSSPPPSPSPEIEDFTEQWCLALDSLGAAVEEAPFFPGNNPAISDLTAAADALDRLVSDLEDAGLSAPASEIRSLAATVREEIAAIDVKGDSADAIAESFDRQRRALKRMRKAFQPLGERFGASC
jgi:transcriptional regulator with XRE-family HTH domain